MGIDVLVVDDDADLRAPLADLLRDEGYLVEELSDADGFCDALERWQPILVLLDLTLPGADIQSVLDDAQERHLRLGRTMLALSGLEDAAERAAELGLDGAIRKPFDIDELLTRVKSVCTEHRRWESVAEPPRSQI